MNDETEIIQLTINGQNATTIKDQTIFDAAAAADISIPELCSDPRTKPSDRCEMCAVEIDGIAETILSCNTAAASGMIVNTESKALTKKRQAILDNYLSDHNAYCLPPCQYACPADIDVAGYLELIANGENVGATMLIKERLPLPGILGRVCPAPCETVCRRAQIDGEPVAICWLKRYAADKAAEAGEKTQPDPAPDSGKSVAVIGSGPAGLSASYYLALDGHKVTIYETHEHAGGMLRYGIPPYRLPKEVLDKEINDILSLGVTLKTGTSLGGNFSISSLLDGGEDAVFLGIGASISKEARVKGERSEGVYSAIEFLNEVNRSKRTKIGNRVAVIGGGFTAADAARTARRLGSRHVSLVYRRGRKEMPASPLEIHECEVEGVVLELLTAPVAIKPAGDGSLIMTCQRMELGEPDDSGRRRPQPVEDSDFNLEVDNILLAIGQDVDMPGTREDMSLTGWGSIEVDGPTMMTSIPKVFAAGDCETGAATVVEAVGGGRRAAKAISAFLEGKGQREIADIVAVEKPKFFDIGAKSKFNYQRAEMPVVPGDVRNDTFGVEVRTASLGADDATGAFREVDEGFTEEQAVAEALRCLQCVCQAAGSCKLQENSILYNAGTKKFKGTDDMLQLTSFPFFVLDMEKCIKCHNCINVCKEVQHRDVYAVGGDEYPVLVSGTNDYRDTECNNCGQCISACPTGALKDITDVGIKRSAVRKKVPTICAYCGVGCSLNLEVEDGKVVAVSNSFESEANNGNLCVKGRFGFDFINHIDRLTTPLLRKGGKGSPLEPVSWDEATTYVADKLNQIKEEHGPNAIAGLNSSKATNEENYVFQRFMRAAIGTNNVDHCARLCHVASAVALDQSIGSSAPTATTRDISEADAIIIIGSNTTETHPVISGAALAARYERDASIIVIDPRRIEMVDHSNIWLRPNAGTNVAVLNAIAKVILDEGLADEAFIASRTEGFEDFKTSLEGYSPEMVEAVTGIDPAKIRDTALTYGRAKRGMILWGMGITQHMAGVDGAYGLVNLSLMTGHIGRPGTGLIPLRGQNNVQGASDMGLPNAFPGYQKVANPEVRKKFSSGWSVEVPDKPGLTVVEMENAAYDGGIKALYVQGENPMLSSPDIDHVKKGLEKLELLVVQDIFMSETAELADVVLPVRSFAEKDGTFTNTERRVQLIRPAIPPIGETRADWDVVCEVSTKMGYAMTFENSATIMEELAGLVPQYAGIRHNRLGNNDLLWPVLDTDHPGTRVLYSETFPRGLGRFTVIEQDARGELPEDKFPMLLSTGRMLEHYHTGTMSRRAKGLDRLIPEAGLEMNAIDIKRFNFNDGETVRLTTKRGSVDVKISESDLPPEGVMFLPFHFTESPANRLTSSVMDPVSKTPIYKTSAARIEKIN
ncbi:MAG: formate dehydrogenase subunit alpha [Rhodospirillaceae bacterium]|jgi:formate dehydrogenase major subunit|nr:formate dehydrogenase subunit alpha [Rhodospirillaceae bacterium]